MEQVLTAIRRYAANRIEFVILKLIRFLNVNWAKKLFPENQKVEDMSLPIRNISFKLPVGHIVCFRDCIRPGNITKHSYFN